ncbi:hypothetical protein [Sharpea azabuensis]|uniref:hypothetical protein n=1 Tax=Sharpea azabuensis TaxID=322505 RepID=UPI00156917CD|nr:hypothetical protein [Sharpea azabuensis]
MINVLLTDPKIAEVVYEDSKNKDKYKICTIRNNGSIVMGKTKYVWWNQFLNCQDVLPFESFALKVWNALVDLSSGINNVAIMKGLSQEIVMSSVRDKKYDWVVDRLYDCWKHVAQKSDGFSSPEVPAGTQVSDQGRRSIHIENGAPNNIVIKVKDQTKVIPIIDSVGDSWEVGLEFGLLGLKRIR